METVQKDKKDKEELSSPSSPPQFVIHFACVVAQHIERMIATHSISSQGVTHLYCMTAFLFNEDFMPKQDWERGDDI